ncbi:hypothetical protein [Paenibacillus sp. YYML68]|uniref:hypothetical protein n=1 Tax=Paenibacillus sp. YYML68 TaxID=2909250 RepID=UPI00248FFDA0|nr:hypothetical protein [Paenibacillus sp. YYML68]
MQKICQKIVRVQNGLIVEIYDGLFTKSFRESRNDKAIQELVMDDIGLDFNEMLRTYERLIYELATQKEELQSYIADRLPEGWLEWIEEKCSELEQANHDEARELQKQSIL